MSTNLCTDCLLHFSNITDQQLNKKVRFRFMLTFAGTFQRETTGKGLFRDNNLVFLVVTLTSFIWGMGRVYLLHRGRGRGTALLGNGAGYLLHLGLLETGTWYVGVRSKGACFRRPIARNTEGHRLHDAI